MEPISNKNNDEDNSEYINVMGFSKDSSLKQDHFLSLRKNKRLNLNLKRLNLDKPVDKYKLDQNSYDQSNEIIKGFFNTQDKPAFLYQLISDLSNSIKNSNIDLNLIKFIIVQCFNYYDSQKENNINLTNLEKFFNDTIITNLIEFMCILNKDHIIVYNISLLLMKLTYHSTQIIKLITLNTNNIEKVFFCLNIENEDINYNILNILYNCYFDDDDNVNTKCNIGRYVFEKLNLYSQNIKQAIKEAGNNDSPLKTLVAFLDILINDKTSDVYKQFDYKERNNIIYLLLVLCKNVLEEQLKLDSFNGLSQLLGLAEPENINVDSFGIFEISDVITPHLKLESNSPEIVEKAAEILEQFSYLCDVEIILNGNIFDEIDNILFTFNDMNTNIISPKPFYKNFTKKNINNILKKLSVVLSNALSFNNHEKYIINKTNIINNLVLCLKIYELENNTIKSIYEFLKEFTTSKDNCVKIILANFIDIGILDILNRNLSNKNFEIVHLALDMCLLMLKESSGLTSGKGNVIAMYLEKKGFNEILNLIIGADFGNILCSETAKNIQDNFFIK